MDGWFFPFGMSGEAIYHNFRDGTGPQGLATGAAYVKDLITNYEQRAESITKLTVKMESAWQGDAAGAARRGAGPLAVEHGLAAPEMNTAQTLVTSQVSAYDRASSAVMEVPPTPEEPGLWDNITSFGGAGRTYEEEMAQVTAANEHNVAVMSTYEDTTSTNTSGMPRSYGSISPDFSAVGVTPTNQPPPPPPGKVEPPQPRDPTQTGDPSNPSTTTNPPGTNPTQPTNPNGPNGPNRPNDPGQTDPGNYVPSPTRPGPGPGPNPNPGPGPGPGPGLPPFLPGGPGFGPTGGGGGGGTGTGPGGGRGGVPAGARGGFGPGGGGAGGFGEDGSRAGARGPAGGLGAGGAAAEAAAARGGAGGAGRGGMGGGMPMGGAGGRGQGGEDSEHQRPSFLVEADPDETFGTDEVTAPPVIGE